MSPAGLASSPAAAAAPAPPIAHRSGQTAGHRYGRHEVSGVMVCLVADSSTGDLTASQTVLSYGHQPVIIARTPRTTFKHALAQVPDMEALRLAAEELPSGRAAALRRGRDPQLS